MTGEAEPEAPGPTLADVRRVETLPELAAVLRQLRRRHARRNNDSELTVRELAARSGYAYGTISEYLSGKALAPTDRLDVLVRLLGATTTEQGALATARDRVEERRRGARDRDPAPRELPPDVSGFTGRAEQLAVLDQLLEQPREALGVCLISAVAGTAGVGKTALAVRWAHRVSDRFPDGCLFIDLQGFGPGRPGSPADALARFLRSLGVDGRRIPGGEPELAARYRTLLAGRRVLVVLDNARSADQVRLLLPAEPGCFVLITSRNALAGLVARHGARRMELDLLPRHDAVDLIGTLVDGRAAAEPEAAAVLAERCARLPLALRLAADLVNRRPGTRLAELTAELADARRRLDRFDAGGDPGTAVRFVFCWSYQNLRPDTARAFRLIGLCPGRDLDEHTMAALADVDLAAAQLMLRDLADAHLIHPLRRGRYGAHDLLRAYAAERAAEEPPAARDAALRRLLDHQLRVCSMAMDLIAPHERDQSVRAPDRGGPAPELTDQRSAIAWLDAERGNLVAAGVRAAGRGWHGHATRLATLLFEYLDAGAHHRDAETLLNCALRSTDLADRCRVLARLGAVRWRQGRCSEALDCHRRSLDLACEIGDRAAQARALASLGVVHAQLGRVDEALDCDQQALDLFRALGDHVGQARVLGNLGNLQERAGRYPEAVDCAQRVLRIVRELGHRVYEGFALGNLGRVYERLGRLSEALECHRRAHRIAGQTGYHSSEAHALGNLGRALERLGRLSEALVHGQRAVAIFQEIGPRGYEGKALSDLCVTFRSAERWAEAVDCGEQALAIAGETNDDYLAAEALNRLGEALRCADEPAAALARHQRAIATARRIGDRYEQARAHDGAARALAVTGGHIAARVHQRRALLLYSALGVPEVVEMRSQLAQDSEASARQPDRA
ncbi:MAG: tetratricopeptide repeat protein [Micromonosporaceae bacterium]|nr:tetratricopeptide repeat protein [Micromonosporaceae bacterium]